ncbi:hypothetical protein BJV82DRAFT_525919 [Fennellomyces sp. T-0311]|nr:hypothetical protein BJV82DRAFT_525919 [Fennellomyces sp. T-0311]
MGFIDKLKNQYEMRKVNKYTKRRLSQSQFASHDRTYYDSVYRDGVYIESDTNDKSRWSFTDLLKRSQSMNKNTTSLAASQLKTSETYTLGLTR